MITNYPNPFTTRTQIEYKVNAGHALLQLLDSSGTVLKILVDAVFNYPGTNSYAFYDNSLLPGIYYIRLQNEMEQHVKAIIKV